MGFGMKHIADIKCLTGYGAIVVISSAEEAMHSESSSYDKSTEKMNKIQDYIQSTDNERVFFSNCWFKK